MESKIKLGEIFTDNMVIQRETKIPIWGWAQDETEIIVEFHGQQKTAYPSNGIWKVLLEPMEAGGPFEMKVTCGIEQVILREVLIGEVWVASGQSNMEYALVNTRHGKDEIPAADYPNIRYYHVPRIPYEDDLTLEPCSEWQRCTPENAGDFSAVAYHFAKMLYKALGVPIGIISCNWGGTSASCWMSEEYLSQDPDLQTYLDEYHELIKEQKPGDYDRALKKYEQEVEAYNERAAKLKFDPERVDDFYSDDSLGDFPWPPPMGPKCFLRPAGIYYTMLRKIVPFSLKGVIWYQGESDVYKGSFYKKLFGKMVENWRNDWGNPSLPFLTVQLTSFGNGNPDGTDWAVLREQQMMAAQTIPNVGMIVSIDCGDRDNIHPTHKKPVGERLALLAQSQVYGLDAAACGPVYKGMKVEGDKAVLYFDHTEGGLAFIGESLTGFKIMGENGDFLDAEAEIHGETVRVYNSRIHCPTAVRYGWANYVEANLYNEEGLPASPFRTDVGE